MPLIEIISEREAGSGWTFHVRLEQAGASTEHTLRLSWADYDLWSPGGADAPAAIARAVIAFLLKRTPGGRLQPSFDAATARRRFPDADTQIPKLIEDGP